MYKRVFHNWITWQNCNLMSLIGKSVINNVLKDTGSYMLGTLVLFQFLVDTIAEEKKKLGLKRAYR